ncbi:MAG TPA: hypothetical protein VGG39_26920 [Polyangiaceae bacterium]|jgi:hypothetical protein
MTLVLDAGALLAIEKGDREAMALLKNELAAGRVPLTHGGIVGQAWRGGAGRQARLARLLPGLTVVPLDADLGKRAGVLLGKTRTTDVVDAALVLLAAHTDRLLTSDPEDLARLAEAAGLELEIVRVG